jgi:hypothetical protein
MKEIRTSAFSAEFVNHWLTLEYGIYFSSKSRLVIAQERQKSSLIAWILGGIPYPT